MARICLLLFLIDTIYALLILAFLNFAPASNYDYQFIIFLWALHTIKYLALTVLLLRVLLKWLTESYVITDKKLTVSRGIYAVTEKVYELEKIDKITVHQDFVGRLLHFGTITLVIPTSGDDQTVELTDVASPKQYEKILAWEYM